MLTRQTFENLQKVLLAGRGPLIASDIYDEVTSGRPFRAADLVGRLPCITHLAVRTQRAMIIATLKMIFREGEATGDPQAVRVGHGWSLTGLG